LSIGVIAVGVFAEGTTELLLALATPTPQGYWGIPTLVWGIPGTGKSTFIESL
jgi:MoxR-like ATPase